MTNDWQYETEGLGYTDAGACHFELSHKQDPSVFRTFVFDAVKNTFETKYQDAT